MMRYRHPLASWIVLPMGKWYLRRLDFTSEAAAEASKLHSFRQTTLLCVSLTILRVGCSHWPGKLFPQQQQKHKRVNENDKASRGTSSELVLSGFCLMQLAKESHVVKLNIKEWGIGSFLLLERDEQLVFQNNNLPDYFLLRITFKCSSAGCVA